MLTWRDFGGFDREALIGARIAVGWLCWLFALVYLALLLDALAALPLEWSMAGIALVLASGLLALALARRVPRSPRVEAAGVLALAAVAVGVRPGVEVLLGLAVALVAIAAVVLARSGTRRHPEIAVRAGRSELVRGWRDRVVRRTAVSFLDFGMLFPAARPVRRRALARASEVSLAWVGVLGRAHHLPTAALLALAAVTTHLAFPSVPEIAVLALFGYLAIVPFGGGLGELWRSTGRRRWIGRSDTVLRVAHLAVLGGLTLGWAGPVLMLAALAGPGWHPSVLVAVPVIAASVVRTATRPLPRFDDLGVVDTPMGMMPVRLVSQVVRGPDVGVVAVMLLMPVPPPVLVSVAVVAGVVVFCVLR